MKHRLGPIISLFTAALLVLVTACDDDAEYSSNTEDAGADTVPDTGGATPDVRPDTPVPDDIGPPDTPNPDVIEDIGEPDSIEDVSEPDMPVDMGGPDIIEDVGEPDTPIDTGGPDIIEDWGIDSTNPDAETDLPVGACATLSQTLCFERTDCVLVQDPDTMDYECRDVRNHCESLDNDACTADDTCAWDPGFCYCPEDVLCICGGGPPPTCRAAGDTVRCLEAGDTCAGTGACCAPTFSDDGVCQAQYGCGAGCTTLVSWEMSGGLCMNGLCFGNIEVRDSGYVKVDGEAMVAFDDLLTDGEWSGIITALAALSPVALEDGYGPCCNSHFDGSDQYLTFYEGDAATRTVRISDSTEAPQELTALAQALSEAFYARQGEQYDPADVEACPQGGACNDVGCSATYDCCSGWICHPSDEAVVTCDMDCGVPVDEPTCVCDGENCREGTAEEVCSLTGGQWGNSGCESCCGPNECGDDPLQQSQCLLACCGPAQCYCPESAPYWSPERGCYDDAACHP